VLEHASFLLGVDPQELDHGLTHRVREDGEEDIPLDEPKAVYQRDLLSLHLYNSIFYSVVKNLCGKQTKVLLLISSPHLITSLQSSSSSFLVGSFLLLFGLTVGLQRV